MTTPLVPDGRPVERQWRDALERGPECLAIERFGEPLTDAEATHVAGCARCQTERDLRAAYDANEPVEGEGLAVEWITAQTKRRLAESHAAAAGPASTGPAGASGTRRSLPRWVLMAASVAIIAGGAALLVTPDRGLDPGSGGGDVYRATRVEVIAPVGDLVEAPTQLVWAAVPDAAQYEVRVAEVDGTELWRVTTSAPAVAVPSDIGARALPAKTLVWHVVARDARGRMIAESGASTFRVRVAPNPPGR